MSLLSPEQVKEWIEAGMVVDSIKVEGDGHHFDAIIVSPAFEGKSTLARHRMVYATLGSKMGNEIHALSIKAHATGEV